MATPLSATSASVFRLRPEHAEQAVEVLADAFFEYPVMQHVIGEGHDDYDGRIRKLMRFFVAARYCRDEPVLAASDSDRAVAVAILTPPYQKDVASSLEAHRESLWKELGKEARSRYEALGDVWAEHGVEGPHYHLNMIGVRKSHAGTGLGRLVLDAVHDLSLDDSDSSGVSLNTEDEHNVPLYEHFGYEVIGHERINENLQTWVMFRPDRG